MRIYKKIGLFILTPLVVLVGLFLPNGVLMKLDQTIAGKQWAIEYTGSDYQYESTLENRVRALDAWQNNSTSVRYVANHDTSIPPDAWTILYTAGLLPASGDNATCIVKSFSLLPHGYSSEYKYMDIVCENTSGCLHVIIDVETGVYLRIDFSGDALILTNWMRNSGYGFATEYKSNTLMDGYAALLNLGDLQDLGGIHTDGDVIQGFESDIQGTPFAISFKCAPSVGLLSYKLFARPLL